MDINWTQKWYQTCSSIDERGMKSALTTEGEDRPPSRGL